MSHAGSRRTEHLRRIGVGQRRLVIQDKTQTRTNDAARPALTSSSRDEVRLDEGERILI